MSFSDPDIFGVKRHGGNRSRWPTADPQPTHSCEEQKRCPYQYLLPFSVSEQAYKRGETTAQQQAGAVAVIVYSPVDGEP